MGAEAGLGVSRASHVRVLRVVRDVAVLVDPLVGRQVRAAVARAGHLRAAVQDVLHGQVDIGGRALARDLDAVGQRGHGAVRPAGAAVLRDVLVQHLRDHALLAPGEVLRQVRRLDGAEK